MVVKKTSAKKAVKKTVKKTVAPVVDHEQTCGCGCGHECHCGCRGHFWKKFLILLVVFALGCLCAGYFCKPHMPKHHFEFDENGCLVAESVKCPMMQKALANADTDTNGCITAEEMRAVKKAMHHKHQEIKK